MFSEIAVLMLLLCATARADLYVATNGNDAWIGNLAAPNKAKSDGPLATIERARDIWRGRSTPAEGGAKKIVVRSGTYYLKAPLKLEPQDSGLQIVAHSKERPVLSGGKPISGWKKDGKFWTAKADWDFRMLRIGGENQTLARFPNFDAANPTTSGWSFIPQEKEGEFGAAITHISFQGDWIEWKVTVPANGDYKFWLYYAAQNQTWGPNNMAGRTNLSVDGGAPVVLNNLPDTGSWRTFLWSDAAVIPLTAGQHTLRWANVGGGGINWDAFAFSNDANWKPEGPQLKPAANGKHVVVVQAEAFSNQKTKELSLNEIPPLAFTDHFRFKQGDLKEYSRSPHPEIHVFPAWGWVNTILNVSKIDAAARTVTVEKISSASEELREGNRYFVSNVFEELDQPGEWWRDEKVGTVYLIPKKTDFAKSPVVAAALDRLFDLQGAAANNQWVENITIKGFEFRDTEYSRTIGVYSPNDAAIRLSGARGCVIENNRFIGVGGYAASMEYRSANNEFVGNEVAFNGQGGVFLSGAGDEMPRDNLIAGNWIHDGGQIYKHVAGVYCNPSSGNRIAHNLIERMPRYAISMKGLDAARYSHKNIVEYNDVRLTNLETNDTGAIEILGREKLDSGNVIQYNRITDSVGLKTTPEGKILTPHMTWGIYLDDYSSGVLVRGNLVARFDWGGISIHGGKDNIVDNNIFVDGGVNQIWYAPIDGFSVNNRFTRNIVSFRAPDAVLTNQMAHPPAQVVSEQNNNVFWHASGKEFFAAARPNSPVGPLTALGNFDQWQAAGFDKNSIIADPLFVNAAADDYRLKPNSPALPLGFKELPYPQMGLAGFARSFQKAKSN